MESPSPQARPGPLGRLADAGLGLSLVFLALLSALIVLQVVCRNFFDLGLPWADELARYSAIAMTYLAAPSLLLQGKHISVDLLLSLLGSGRRRIVEALNECLIIAFCALTLWGFYKFLLRAAKFSTPSLGMPNLYWYLPALAGIAGLALVALVRLAALARPAGREDGR